MKLVVDLHSHSGHAGGVGNLSLPAVADTMLKKGIDVFGTGDCLQLDWLEFLQKNLLAREEGLFSLDKGSPQRFLLQTEIIITCPVESGGRKQVHTVILLPSFSAARQALALLQKWGVKVNMGRPFVVCESPSEIADKMSQLAACGENVLVIPAHVLTPQGIYGPNNPVNSMSEFFGDFAGNIHVIETGLSADPQILGLIPELDNITFISNSDCHSPALNRVGREFTALDVYEKSYHGIAEALLTRRVLYTAEFTPSEGRYFLTGHRGGKGGHKEGEFCFFSPDTAPETCPVCGKTLTVGVLQRALELGRIQGEERNLDTLKPAQEYKTMVPLTEVIAAGLGVQNSSSAKVMKPFEKIIGCAGTECSLWEMDSADVLNLLKDTVDENIVESIMQVHAGNFCFYPLGYDGEYGSLEVGKTCSWFGHEKINADLSTGRQQSLF